MPALAALAISQIVIVGAWNDAKFGTIANLIVLIPVVIAALAHAPWSFRAQYEHDVADGLAHTPTQVGLVTEADIAPQCRRRCRNCMRFAGVVGQPRVWNYRLQFRGALRNSPNDASNPNGGRPAELRPIRPSGCLSPIWQCSACPPRRTTAMSARPRPSR